MAHSLVVVAAFGLFIGESALAQARADTNPLRCVAQAAQHHQVNSDLLKAILVVESRARPLTVTANSNKSIDVGIGGYNSINFPELAQHDIAPAYLLDACIATYVSAWHLSKKIAKFGNNWYGIAAYHSTTPQLNARYQILVFNELVRSGAMMGPVQPVPPLPDASSPIPTNRKTQP